MFGAIIGDISGSAYEFDNVRRKDFYFFNQPGARPASVTDDSICTAAIADAILSEEPFSEKLRYWGRRYATAGYGGMFNQWLQDDLAGPYKSWGNGSAMRASPCALLASSDEEAVMLARAQAEVSHNHPNAVHAAMALVHAIRMAYRKMSPSQIKDRLERQWGYDLSISMEGLQHELNGMFDVSAGGCLRIAMVSCLSATSYEDAIRNCISLGGDCDTTSAIAGPVAEALFGIPPALLEDGLKLIPDDVIVIIQSMYNDERAKDTIAGDMGDSLDIVMFEESSRRIMVGNQMYLRLFMRHQANPG